MLFMANASADSPDVITARAKLASGLSLDDRERALLAPELAGAEDPDPFLAANAINSKQIAGEPLDAGEMEAVTDPLIAGYLDYLAGGELWQAANHGRASMTGRTTGMWWAIGQRRDSSQRMPGRMVRTSLATRFSGVPAIMPLGRGGYR